VGFGVRWTALFAGSLEGVQSQILVLDLLYEFWNSGEEWQGLWKKSPEQEGVWAKLQGGIV
jgi:hypothetical protein